MPSLTQEQLMNMEKLHAPEFVERNGVLYYCTYTNLFNIWHKILENPNYPEWNFIDTHDLDYNVYTGNRKPTKEEIVSSDDFFKNLKENNYWGTVCFDTGEGTIYQYKCFDDCVVCKSFKVW